MAFALICGAVQTRVKIRPARVREAVRVTGLAASGLQALTLLQRSKKKKERCKTSDCSPLLDFSQLIFHP